MYTLIRSLSLRSFVFEQAPTIGISLVIAELLYKFHSFILECIAFLATWYVLDSLNQFFIRWLKLDRNRSAR
jgi:hypothetical protein